ncbi:lycopene cyclase domain-containing protein [Olivibacter sp. SDN3]|uniref:lycopene cyclase domain-containing protein n=1 Tax=Olivibacter sp. SDN3 TaxID=2764720 RepID=UPI0016519C39|nr:lycopene cyclase domain-containing protein [Olivibacter sp. SDN3]QNL51691.1 lycopene cyclase domain-containing protein [Olivibacter sp. SDN3]
MLSYTYLLINFFTVVICFIFSFHPKIRFDRYFLPFFKASILVAIPFILWDAYFTKTGVWWFNDAYLLGLRLLDLPIEEWLFFICIPFSCMYTYFCLDHFFNLRWRPQVTHYFALAAITGCLLIGLLHTDKIYTLITFITTASTLIFLKFVAKVDWIDKISFVYGILLLPFFIVNGLLTGTGLEQPIVNYNPDDFMNIRVLTVPIEDAVYGFELILWNLYFFNIFSKK